MTKAGGGPVCITAFRHIPRQFSFQSINIHSVLGAFLEIMCYMKWYFTYLLIYLLNADETVSSLSLIHYVCTYMAYAKNNCLQHYLVTYQVLQFMAE